jgi:uncharacterized protein
MRAILLVLTLILTAALIATSPEAQAAVSPRVAIVFEHAGPSLSDLTPIYAMHKPFGLGIFPRMRYSAQIAREAAAHGLTPMLHLPMEARNPADMGQAPGAVWVRMTDVQIARVVDEDLESAPGVVGVSNHAGSRATADPRVMAAVLRTVKAKGLWFEENRTTPASVASTVAAGLGMRVVLVTTFLDDPPVDIEGKVRALIATATTRGSVVAVAHITTGAPQVVRRLLPEFQRARVVFVPVTEFLKEAGRP